MASVGIISPYTEIPSNIIKIDGRVYHENFKIEWRKFLKRFDDARDNIYAFDNATKLISDLVYDLAELVHFNSSLITVRTSTFGTNKNTYEHFIRHLSKEIFTKKGIFLFGNFDNALRYAELLYTDDSIIRFLPELVVKPNDVHEKEICMIGSPKEIIDWIVKFENMHYRNFEKREEARDLFEELFKEKNNVIKTAIEMKIFLPISPRTIISEDKDYLLDRIKKSWMRNKKVNFDTVLNYLYLNEIENIKSLSVF